MRLLTALLLVSSWTLLAETRVVADNDAVRILSATEAPGEKTPLHRHARNRVIVFLDDGDLRETNAQGRAKDVHWKAGQVVWSGPTGLHISENTGATPLRIVEIELKEPAPEKAPARNPELDPIAIDPKHNVMILENDFVRVFKSWREPGGTEMMHEHAGKGRAVVQLTDLDASEKLADGTVRKVKAQAGDVAWSDPMVHATTNLGTNTIEMVVVEVK